MYVLLWHVNIFSMTQGMAQGINIALSLSAIAHVYTGSNCVDIVKTNLIIRHVDYLIEEYFTRFTQAEHIYHSCSDDRLPLVYSVIRP